MLKYFVLLLAIVYIGFLFYLKFYRQAKTQKVLLVVQKNTQPQSLEWIIYSFHRFLERNHLQLDWWIYAEDCLEVFEKKKMLRRLSRRFNFKLLERYYRTQDYVYIFYAGKNTKPSHWQQECSNHLQSRQNVL